MNRFARTLLTGKMMVTAECLPPAGSDPAAFKAISCALPLSLDAIVVGDNPDRIRASAFSLAAALRKERQTSVILSMAMRDRNRIALMSDALGAAALGIDALLCMSGSHQSIGVCREAAAANDVDSVQFIQAMKKMVLSGSGPNGKKIEPELKLQIGATAHPYMQPIELNLSRLKKKVSVGADFLMTQAVFDIEGFQKWMDAVRAADLDKRSAIIPSVLPLTSVEQARALQRSRIYGPVADETVARIESAADAAEEGLSIAVEIAVQLRMTRGVRGIHILDGGGGSVAARVIQGIALSESTKGTPDVSPHTLRGGQRSLQNTAPF